MLQQALRILKGPSKMMYSFLSNFLTEWYINMSSLFTIYYTYIHVAVDYGTMLTFFLHVYRFFSVFSSVELLTYHIAGVICSGRPLPRYRQSW